MEYGHSKLFYKNIIDIDFIYVDFSVFDVDLSNCLVQNDI